MVNGAIFSAYILSMSIYIEKSKTKKEKHLRNSYSWHQIFTLFIFLKLFKAFIRLSKLVYFAHDSKYIIFWKDFVLKSLLWYADDHHEAIQKLESSSGLFMVSRTLL